MAFSHMLDDVRGVLPSAYAAVPLERVVAQITKWGMVELEFCCATQQGLFMTYLPHLSDESPPFGLGGAPYDIVLAAACLAYLRQRFRQFSTDQERVAWAIKHSWPKPELFVPGAVVGPGGQAPVDQAAILDAIGEGGKHDPHFAFLLNLAIVVWGPNQREFRFPDISDHLTATACRDYLRRSALALHDLPGQRLADDSHPFAPLIEYATRHSWPEVDALVARAALWRTFRPKRGWPRWASLRSTLRTTSCPAASVQAPTR